MAGLVPNPGGRGRPPLGATALVRLSFLPAPREQRSYGALTAFGSRRARPGVPQCGPCGFASTSHGWVPDKETRRP